MATRSVRARDLGQRIKARFPGVHVRNMHAHGHRLPGLADDSPFSDNRGPCLQKPSESADDDLGNPPKDPLDPLSGRRPAAASNLPRLDPRGIDVAGRRFGAAVLPERFRNLRGPSATFALSGESRRRTRRLASCPARLPRRWPRATSGTISPPMTARVRPGPSRSRR